MRIYHSIILGMVFLAFSCKKEPPAQETAEIAIKEWKAEDLRSMSGVTAKRGLVFESEGHTPGYVLYEPSSSTFSFLLDKQGNVVHKWESDLNSMNSYLQPNGHLIRLERDADFPTFAAGGQAGRIREYSWDGELLWDYELANEVELLHHDIEIMPNGHILGISYEVVPREEVLDLGMDPEKAPKAGIWLDKIVEIKPTGPTGGEVVWVWKMKDHLVQDMFPQKKNYGVLSENPRRISINTPSSEAGGPPLTEDQIEQFKKMGFMTSNASVDNQGSDISHTNAVAYNPELDQIAISLPGFSEIFIIDHSTSTEEAKGTTGGRWGHGGDLLYRWGNPQNYGRGSKEDVTLFAQHDIKWIPRGYPGEGQLMVYNNDIDHPDSKLPSMWAGMDKVNSPEVNMSIGDVGNYSAICQWAPPVDSEGRYLLEEGKAFGPAEPDWEYKAPDLFSFYSAFISGAQRLKNGNTLITEGMRGRFFEINPDKEIVWEYWNPYKFDYKLPDGSPAQPVGPFMYNVFRSTLYTTDFPAFEGKDLVAFEPQPKPFVFEMPPIPKDSALQQ